MAVGKITGEMLQNNLVRDGINLAFETDLLFLDVNNGRVGIKTSAPTHPLHVVGTARTQNVDVSNSVTVGDFTLSGSTIASTTGSIFFNLAGAGAAVYNSRLLVDDFEITDNELRITDTNKDLEIRPNGTGELKIYGDTEVFGNLHATGTITADGNLQLGNDAGDNITFVGEVNSDIIPDADNTYNLGSASRRWTNIYSNVINADVVVSNSLIVDGVDVVTPQGNIIYVSANGDNDRSGTHQNDTYATVEKALSVAVAGDTVFIYPGVYDELLPLTVPVGVTVKGVGLRSVTIRPDTASTDQDVFLLNGESTVEDIAISGYQYNSGANTGHAFRFASNMTVTTRSPYIRNVSVITSGTVTSATDPRGYLTGDAGRGAYIDGSVVNAASKEASMLFHSVTFICPGVDAITMTNGVRVEWLNSFTYFATKSMYAISGNLGFASNGKTTLRIPTVTGTWNVGNTISYYDTDGVTVLASGVIESKSGNYYTIDGKASGFETPANRVTKTVFAQGNAKLSIAQKKFGASSLSLDGTGDYVSLATNPDFAFPSTTVGKTITAYGNAAVSATQSKFGGASIVFDGTSDYLRVASNADFDFGTGEFTLECWVRQTSVTGTQIIFDFRNDGTTPSSYAPTVTLISGTLYYQTRAGNRITGTLLTINTWYHVALARSGTSTKLFLNGTQVGSTYTDTNTYIQSQLTIGAQYNGSNSFNGYIDEIRVSNIARYTTGFTPSAVALTSDSYSKLLIHGDSTIVDDITAVATDFTMEAWIYPTVGSTFHSIFDSRSVSTEEAIYLGINTSNQVYLYVNGAVTITTAAVSLSVWTHVALVRSSGTTKIYLNGTQSGSSWVDITNYGTTKPLYIGAWFNTLYGFTGYIDDVRISKYVARYTATFTPPTVTFVGDNNTVLLLRFDGPDTSTTIVDDGVTLQDLRTSAGGTATLIETADFSEFGAEVRAIGSASVYGEYGAYGDGEGVLMYMIGHNFAYIGVEQLVNNDPADAIQVNEVVTVNRADIHYNSIDHKGDFRVGDYFKVDQQNGTITFSSVATSITSPEGLTFTDGINTTIINSGEVITGNLRIAGNSITATNANGNIELTPNGTGVVKVNGTQSLLIPVGSSGQRPTAATGQMRYNTDLGRFEGYNGTVWTQLGGISDVDQNTYILPESAPNANDNLMTFVAGGVSVATLSSTTFTVNQVDVDNIRLSGNAITATNSDGDIVLSPNGVGAVVIDNLRFSGNSITNSVAGAITDFAVTGDGYIRIPGTNGLVIPSGDSANRPPSVETGLMRYNSDLQLVEIWDGFSWVSTAGAAAGITASTATDIAVAAALMLG